MINIRLPVNRSRRSLVAAGCLKYSRFHTSAIRRNNPNEIAFVFDIDGVLIRGGQPIPQAKPTLELLKSLQVPFMLLTNGGGVTEHQRTQYLSKNLGTYLNPIQIVQSHTPFKTLTNAYRRVLVVGGPEDKARHAAISYGFQEVVIPADIVRADPSIWPFHKYTAEQLDQWGDKSVNVADKPFDAIFVFNDPRDMGSDLQIILDLLNSENGYLGTKRNLEKLEDRSKPAIPIYFSNNDLLWANEYKLSRLGQGAFRICVERLYQELNEVDKLEDTIIGKPNVLTYDYVHNALIDWRLKILANNDLVYHPQELTQVVPQLGEKPQNSPFKKVYMIGDNPASDIQGANNYGWESCLVKTGVYQDSDFHNLTVKPTHIVDNVYEAITTVLKTNQINF
ncbi:hypothetical protein DASC09_046590 [Saccharomycopsis crataegensis]|uniref:HAD-superfamily hydrolase n=1 Tax=Saccharomycopsis crataegensis TaxID=43959 RepID=A0AAV5QS79_9ASCO|nr:hypothetical protein DASC09_046590 [Saccharomycopsis crataegensis]